jgi:hypothetical protein
MPRHISVIGFIAVAVSCTITLRAEQSRDEGDIRQVQVCQAMTGTSMTLRLMQSFSPKMAR